MSRGQDCYWIDSQGSIPHTYIHNIYPAPKAVLLKLKNWIHMQSRKWGQKDYKIETNRCWTLWLCLIHRQVLFWAFLEISITPLTFLQTRPGVDLSSGLQNHRFSLLCFSPVLHLCDDVQGCVCVCARACTCLCTCSWRLQVNIRSLYLGLATCLLRQEASCWT